MTEGQSAKRDSSRNTGGETFCALYYPETICLNELELKYLLLLYDKIFFLPIDVQLNPGHTSLSKRFSPGDSILTGAFKSKEAAHYAIMYSSESNIWDDRMKRLMALYEELEERGILIGLQDESFSSTNECHPLKMAVDADMEDGDFVSLCHRYQNEKIHVPMIDNAKIKGGGLVIRSFTYKANLGIPSICSERLNSALFISGRDNLFPVTGSSMYSTLLNTKLKRATLSEQAQKAPPNSVQKFSLLSWEVVTEVIPRGVITSKPANDILRYKSACGDLKQRFRSYLWSLEAAINSEPWEQSFSKELDSLVKKELLPEVQRIRDQKVEIWEKLFGDVLKTVTSWKVAPPLIGIQLVPGLSFWEILALSTSAVGTMVLPNLVNVWQEERKLRRNALLFLIKFRR